MWEAPVVVKASNTKESNSSSRSMGDRVEKSLDLRDISNVEPTELIRHLDVGV